MDHRAAFLGLSSVFLAGSLVVHMAACSSDTVSTASDAASPVDAGAGGSDAGADGADAAPFCPVGPVTGSCESSASMGPSLYTRFCSDLIDTSTCIASSNGQGSGTSSTSKVSACPTDVYLIGRCAYATACRNDVNVYAYSLPGNPDSTVEKAKATCTAAGGTWQELADGGSWVTR